MCSNTGDPDLWGLSREEALARADHLAELGFRRVVLTGGEPTIHRAFWEIVDRLGERGLVWDVNTNGGRFADEGVAERARARGLVRAILSLHHHEEGPSRVMSGLQEGGHARILASADALLASGAELMLNLVLSRLNQGDLEPYLEFVARRWGPAVQVKFSFPSLVGKGGRWEGIALRYEELRQPLQAALARARALGLQLLLESVPSCIHGELYRGSYGRAGFGESHYLDDRDGRTLYGIPFLEAMIGLYAPPCATCPALPTCPGVPSGYARRHGLPDLRPFPAD